jgi:RNA polymerase sigma factor (sigma-70 family)
MSAGNEGMLLNTAMPSRCSEKLLEPNHKLKFDLTQRFPAKIIEHLSRNSMPMNDPTSISLIGRAANTADTDSWNRLAELYIPLMDRWLRQYDVQKSDADDVIQEVLAAVMQELPRFEHSGQTGAFRNWLKKILVNRLRNLWRNRKFEPQARGTSSLFEQLNQLEDDTSEVSRIWNAEHDEYVIAQLMEAVRPRFQPKTWEAFRRQIFEGERPEVVAAELKLHISSVYAARSRVLNALRQEALGLVDSIG